MSRRHYERIAAFIAREKRNVQSAEAILLLNRVMNELAKVFEESNTAFNRSVFIDACFARKENDE